MPNNQNVSHSQSIFDQKNDFDFLAFIGSIQDLIIFFKNV